MVTGGLVQYSDNGHFTVFNDVQAARQYRDFLSSALYDEPTITTERTDATAIGSDRWNRSLQSLRDRQSGDESWTRSPNPDDRKRHPIVGPATFEGLSGQPPMVGNDHLGHGQAMNHIHWARWAEVACVAPLTANTMAKMASGFADDAVTTTLLALGSTIPLVLAPAMNTEMWNHPAVQENLHKIMGWDHIHVLQPIEKRLACGEFGAGALADPQDILHACETRFQIPEQPATVGLR